MSIASAFLTHGRSSFCHVWSVGLGIIKVSVWRERTKTILYVAVHSELWRRMKVTSQKCICLDFLEECIL